jgi:hypothetical protein
MWRAHGNIGNHIAKNFAPGSRSIIFGWFPKTQPSRHEPLVADELVHAAFIKHMKDGTEVTACSRRGAGVWETFDDGDPDSCLAQF